MSREQEIKEIAYRIWEDEGRPEGRDFDHYLRAEQAWDAQNGAVKAEKAAARRPRAASARKTVKKAS